MAPGRPSQDGQAGSPAPNRLPTGAWVSAGRARARVGQSLLSSLHAACFLECSRMFMAGWVV